MKSLNSRLLCLILVLLSTEGCESIQAVHERHPRMTEFVLGSLMLCTAGAIYSHGGHGPVRQADIVITEPNCSNGGCQ